jgi:hypothetical protein
METSSRTQDNIILANELTDRQNIIDAYERGVYKQR